MADARALMAAAGGTSSASPGERPRGQRAQYPARMGVDFTQLRVCIINAKRLDALRLGVLTGGRYGG
jgi:hypothetical protein